MSAKTGPAASQMTAAELVKHPEYPHVQWDLKPKKSGLVKVAEGRRGGPFNVYYEIHGHGPIRTVWIMGLGGLRSLWQRQTKDFGHTSGRRYSCLISDNRGMGKSDKPLTRSSTSEMAKDTIEMVDAVGWTGERQLHVIGVSMGGMIAQEMGLLIPERIASLTLLSTAPRIFNTVGYFENLRNRINLFIPKSMDKQIASVKENLYTSTWLQAPDDAEYQVEPFPTNGDRFGAYELTKRSDPESFTRIGLIGQALAAGWHNKTAEQLKELGDKVGRDRILIIHGTEDKMITFPHAEVLLKELGGEDGGVTWIRVEGQGHAIPAEKRKEFKKWVEKLIKKTEGVVDIDV